MSPTQLATRVLGLKITGVLLAVALAGCGPVDLEQLDKNRAPTADAGADRTADAGSAVQLDGTASADPDGDVLSFDWAQVAGDAVALTGADTATPSFQAPADDATMVFSLTVDDGIASATDFVTIECRAVAGAIENAPPVADAGSDADVEGGAGVQLDGTASFDPDGASVSHDWTQIGGSPVSLTGAQTATPTFTAPNEDTTLTFELTVSDGAGASDSDTVDVEVTARIAVLYVANFTGESVVSFADPASLNGNITPDINLQGVQTLLDQPSDVIVTADDDLIVSNFIGSSITSYDDAPTANGNLAPDGNVVGAATLLDGPTSIAMNHELDLLLVADTNRDAILVYGSASSSSFNGNRAPVRVIATPTTGDLVNPFGINFGADDELYVANNGGNNILVFANASNLNGDVAPARRIESTEFTGTFDVFIDSADNMYVLNSGDDRVLIFTDASTRNGTFDPDFILEVVGGTSLTAVAVDVNGVGYLVDNLEDSIFSYDGIATLNGPLTPDRTIRGANTLLDGPIRLFLAE